MSGANFWKLVGQQMASSDMESKHKRIPYLQSTTIGPSSPLVIMNIDRDGPYSLLNCREMHLEFGLTLTSTDLGICVDQSIVHPFQRIRILCGSAELLNIDNSHLLAQLLFHTTHKSNESGFANEMIGNGNLVTRQAYGDFKKNYVIPVFPEGTILNRHGLLNINAMNPITIEFTMLPAAAFLYSPANHLAATYTMSEVELHASYISSPSIMNFFKQNNPSFSCQDYSHRLNYIQACEPDSNRQCVHVIEWVFDRDARQHN